MRRRESDREREDVLSHARNALPLLLCSPYLCVSSLLVITYVHILYTGIYINLSLFFRLMRIYFGTFMCT